jgi:eukaryotic-like serine/threonine-protein kinase
MAQSPTDQDEKSVEHPGMQTRLARPDKTGPPVKQTDHTMERSAMLPGFTPETDGLIGKTIGPYDVLEELGSGGMAVVYKARHVTLDRIVALKEIQRNFCQEPRFLKRFQSEARTAARILHPHVVTLYEYLFYDSRHFLILEYVPGGTLQDRWKDKPMPFEEALRALEQLLDGLDVIHSEQIVHRDLKPQNVLIDARGNLKIADFGLAHLLGDQLSSVMGTARYMPPESCSGDAQGVASVDQRADIYSLGLMMYELILGREQFETVMGQQSNWSNSLGGWLLWHCSEELRLPLLNTMRPDIPAQFASIIAKMLEKNPDKRYTSVVEILRELHKPNQETSGQEISPSSVVTLIPPNVKTLPTQPFHDLPDVGDRIPDVDDRIVEPTEKRSKLPLGIIVLTVLGLALLAGLFVWRPWSRTIEQPAPPAVAVIDGMVLVPAGPFEMGTDRGTEPERGDSWPIHSVNLDAFYIDKAEVTNSQYKAFCDAVKRPYPQNPSWDPDYFLGSSDHPVIGVSWDDARAYASWAGKRLPTEAEWEKAARGDRSYRWTWGNKKANNVANLDGSDDGYLHTAPAGTFPQSTSPYGAVDMIGNVWEWVEDNYKPYPGGRQDIPEYKQNYHVLRGGGFFNGPASSAIDSAFRGFAPAVVPGDLKFAVGFRCVRDAEKK